MIPTDLSGQLSFPRIRRSTQIGLHTRAIKKGTRGIAGSLCRSLGRYVPSSTATRAVAALREENITVEFRGMFSAKICKSQFVYRVNTC
jgi:hypothetical protein